MTTPAPPQYGEQNYDAPPTQQTTTPQGGGAAPPPFEGTVGQEKFPQQPVYRDQGWIIPFVLQFIVMIALAIYYGSQTQSSSSTTTTTTTTNQDYTKVYVSMVLAVVFPIITAGLSLWAMRNYAHCLVWTSLLLGCVMCLIMAVVFFAIGGSGIILGIFCVIAFIFNALWICAVRSRIPFAVAVLEVCVDVINQRSATINVSAVSIIIQAGWQVAWLFAARGVYLKAASSTNNSTLLQIIYFFLALSYYWTSQVVGYVVLTTCGGVMAEWYFKAPNQPDHATTRSLTRATTTSFGSICYGAFLIAVVKALRESARQSGRRGGILACIAMCILTCFRDILETVNYWAYTYVAVYGMTYCDACRSTFNLFVNRGFDLIINDDLTAGVLVLMAFIAAAISGILSFVLSKYILAVDITWIVLSTIVAFWFGLIFSICALNVISSAIAALFVCYAEDPAALANTKPEVYNKLTTAFMARYSEVAMFKTYYVGRV